MCVLGCLGQLGCKNWLLDLNEGLAKAVCNPLHVHQSKTRLGWDDDVFSSDIVKEGGKFFWGGRDRAGLQCGCWQEVQIRGGVCIAVTVVCWEDIGG